MLMKMMIADETQIQIFANWPMPHAKRATIDNKKNPEYHVVAAIARETADRQKLSCKRSKMLIISAFILELKFPTKVANGQHVLHLRMSTYAYAYALVRNRLYVF